MAKVTGIEARKADHIRINLEEDVRSGLTSGLERYRFIHQALPELDLAQVDARVQWFDKTLRAPLLISSMTGGTEAAREINQTLAAAAQAAGIAMGLGSQRAAIERPELAPANRDVKLEPVIDRIRFVPTEVPFHAGPSQVRPSHPAGDRGSA